jgi:hypothetical protein
MRKSLLISGIVILSLTLIAGQSYARIKNPTQPSGSTNTVQYNNGAGFSGINEMAYSSTTGQTRFTAQAGFVYGTSVSTGGIVNITGSNTTSSALTVFSSQGTNQAGRMVYFNCTGTANAQECFGINSAASSSSALGITASSTNKGAVKITHTGTGNDSNASAISIDLAGVGTAAQGIFMDSTTGGTSGFLIQARNNGKTVFTVQTNSSSTTSTTAVFGNTTLPACLEMGDSDGSGITYITAANGVLAATSTKPIACN